MKLYNTQISAIVLAGERPERHSADKKFGPFTPVGGKCAIDYVLETIQGSNIINNVIVVADKSKEQLILNNVKEKKKIDGLMKPDDIAQNYLMIHNQPKNAWTFELDLRPWVETW